MSKNDLTFGALLLTVMATLVAAVVVEVGAVPATNANASLAQVVRRADPIRSSAAPIELAHAGCECLAANEQHTAR